MKYASLGVRVPLDLRERLESLASKKDRSMAQLIRLALTEYLTKHNGNKAA